MSDASATRPSFADILRQLMDAGDVSGAELARALGTNKTSVSRWRSGEDLPRPLFVVGIAQHLRVEPAKLLEAAGYLPTVATEPGIFPATKAEAEWLELFRQLPTEHRSPIQEAGLRAEEVCRMQTHDLNFEQGWVLVHGKGHKDRVLSIVGSEGDTQRVTRLLRDWLDTQDGIVHARAHQFVWTSIRGTPLNPDELRRVLARLCSEAGLDSNRPPHAFRRYVFTEHYKERPSSIRRLAARMGWSERSHKMISVYTHGVELELAREPLPLLSTRRKEAQPIVNDPALTYRVTEDRSRTVSHAPHQGRHP